METEAKAKCEVAGCDRPVRSKGRCGRCYVRKLRAEHANTQPNDAVVTAPPKESTVQMTVKVPISVHAQLKRAGQPAVKVREILTAWASRPDLFNNLAMLASSVEE